MDLYGTGGGIAGSLFRDSESGRARLACWAFSRISVAYITSRVGLVGREGMVGVTLALGIPESPARAIVQGKGTAMRMPAPEFAKEVKRNEACWQQHTDKRTPPWHWPCMSQHVIKNMRWRPRLARWLLMSRDCLATSTFEITQEFLGQMLGARRPSVNIAASALQRRGLVSYSRGIVKLLDVPGLQVASCSCYAVIRRLTRE